MVELAVRVVPQLVVRVDHGLVIVKDLERRTQVFFQHAHESELTNAYDYRTFHHPGGAPLIVIRGEDMTVRSFYNICPHRGNTLLYEPVGNAKRITCIFHAWSFNTRGDCIDISRAKQGYQERYTCDNAGLREVKTTIGYGGFVWVNVDDDSCTLREYVGDVDPDEAAVADLRFDLAQTGVFAGIAFLVALLGARYVDAVALGVE